MNPNDSRGFSPFTALAGAVIGAAIVFAYFTFFSPSFIKERNTRLVFNHADVQAPAIETAMGTPGKYHLAPTDYNLQYKDDVPNSTPIPYGSGAPSNDLPRTGGIHVTQQVTFADPADLKRFINDVYPLALSNESPSTPTPTATP